MCDCCKFYKDYYEENKNKEKEYYKENRVKILSRNKEYYATNKEDVLKQIKEYQERKKEELKKKRGERIECECGGRYTISNKHIHYKTKKHQNYVNKV
jgi:hypothetical protein